MMVTAHTQATEAQTPVEARMCADHYPPFTIYEESEGPPTGSLVNIIREVTDALGFTLSFTPETPFRRCLSMMSSGKVDIMGGLLYSDARAKYIYLFPYLTKSKKSFFARKDSPLDIQRFEDLRGLSIGTTLGHQYWPEFDQAESLFYKSSAAHVNDNFRRLLAGRIDLVIATERQALFLLADNPDYAGKFKVQPFSFTGENTVYIGVSKQSELAKHKDRLEAMIHQLLTSQAFERISTEFYNNYFNGQSPFTADE